MPNKARNYLDAGFGCSTAESTIAAQEEKSAAEHMPTKQNCRERVWYRGTAMLRWITGGRIDTLPRKRPRPFGFEMVVDKRGMGFLEIAGGAIVTFPLARTST